MFNDVIDITGLIYGAALTIIALTAAFIASWQIRRRKATLAQKRKNALKSLEPALYTYYVGTNVFTDPSHYETWRIRYVQLAEKKFNPDIWMTCIETQGGCIPPLDITTGELIAT
jgi:hypothetical protein